jgi:hypothetical protein
MEPVARKIELRNEYRLVLGSFRKEIILETSYSVG